MSRRFGAAIALVFAGAGLLLAGCSSGTVTGNATPAPGSASASTGVASSGAASDDVPTVQNPLPASVLDGNPCDSALTTNQVESFIGSSDAPSREDIATGSACNWHSADGVSGQISVYYDTKTGGGLNLDYKNAKPQSSRWEPTVLQGFPAVARTGKSEDQSITGGCNVSVGIRDDLTFGVGLTLGDSARKRGVDSCEGAKDVANTVLTNLKGRA